MTARRTPKSQLKESRAYRLEADTESSLIEIEKEITRKVKTEREKPRYPFTLKVTFRNQRDCDRFAKLLRIELHATEKVIVFKPSRVKSTVIGKFIDKPRTQQRKTGLSDFHATHWKQMPEFEQEESIWAYHSVKVTFNDAKAYALFANLVRQFLDTSKKSIYYPAWSPENVKGKKWVSSLPPQDLMPRYPIYIISLGRAYSRMTSKTLEAINVPYYIVVEPQEYEAYASVISPKKILTLPFTSDPKNPTGPGRARNWCRDHSFSMGYKRHWVMDDNIDGFYRLHQNKRYRVADGAIFRAAEDFVDRYENVWVAGFQYRFFCAPKSKYPPFVANTRIYSCLLIDNEMMLELDGEEFLWRERYNEDTILSLDILENGYCTVQFNSFLQGKVGTQTLRGGNSAIFYDVEGTQELKGARGGKYNPSGTIRKSLNLVEMYPEVARIAYKYGRAHHQVDYSKYKNNRLILKRDVVLRDCNDDYGMTLVKQSAEDARADELLDSLEEKMKTKW